MKARGKPERSEARRPWLAGVNWSEHWKCEISWAMYSALSELHRHSYFSQGRRASLARRLPLANIFRAFGAADQIL